MGFAEEPPSPVWDPEDPKAILAFIRWLAIDWGERYWISDDGDVYVYPPNPKPVLPDGKGGFFDESREVKLERGNVLKHDAKGHVEVWENHGCGVLR